MPDTRIQTSPWEFTFPIDLLACGRDAGENPDQQRIHITALVEKANRTSHNLKGGEIVNVVYTVTAHPKGWTGPGEIPILAEKDKTLAYLSRAENSTEYVPTAGAMSFRNF